MTSNGVRSTPSTKIASPRPTRWVLPAMMLHYASEQRFTLHLRHSVIGGSCSFPRPFCSVWPTWAVGGRASRAFQQFSPPCCPVCGSEHQRTIRDTMWSPHSPQTQPNFSCWWRTWTLRQWLDSLHTSFSTDWSTECSPRGFWLEFDGHIRRRATCLMFACTPWSTTLPHGNKSMHVKDMAAPYFWVQVHIIPCCAKMLRMIFVLLTYLQTLRWMCKDDTPMVRRATTHSLPVSDSSLDTLQNLRWFSLCLNCSMAALAYLITMVWFQYESSFDWRWPCPSPSTHIISSIIISS